jgi:serine/threonine protein kinase
MLGKVIGHGAFGTVYVGLHRSKGNQVAIKILNLKAAAKDVVEKLQAEIELLKSLDHINIVRYIDHIRKSKTELCIVMEYFTFYIFSNVFRLADNSLSKMIKSYGKFFESLTKTYMKKVLCGLVYLHDQGVVHRDIKPDNILIMKEGEVKLADFGVSTRLSGLTDGDKNEDVLPAGTPFYSIYC